jgi:ribosomal protein S18 acetylase RimI-like enzyme
MKVYKIAVRPMTRQDYKSILAIEKKVYRKNDLQGPSLITHIRQKNGLEYSRVATVKQAKTELSEIIGYLVVIDDKMDDGRRCVYLDDIAVVPSAQCRGIGWKLLESLVKYLGVKSKKLHRPVLLDMHLRPSSLNFMDKYHHDLVKLGATILEDESYPDYYEPGSDAWYRVYRVINH